MTPPSDLESVYREIFECNSFISSNLARYFCLEENCLFPELEKVMPKPSSTAVMKDEHNKILNLCNAVQELLGVREKINMDKEMLQSGVISLVDMLQRHLQKKAYVLYYEAQSMLSPSVQEEIYAEKCKRLSVTAHSNN